MSGLYPINGTRLTHLDDGGTNDIGYDGVQRQIGLRHLRSDNSTAVGFTHAYDRADNKLIEEKLHAAGESELYRYDSLYRLLQFERGTLNSSKNAIDVPGANVPQHGTWTLDGAGNWARVDGETREHSSFNEITSRSPAGGTPITLAYDDNGNLTDDGDRTFEWDVFDRLRRVRRKSDGQLIAEYTYDVLGRRVRKTVSNSGPLDGATLYYYDGQQVIEEQNAAEVLTQQYVYGNYIDEVLVMDRNLDGDNSATGPGDQRLFFHQNNLMHVYALTDSAGTIVEGYLFDAYGGHTLYQPTDSGGVIFGGSHTTVTNGNSGVANTYLFTGRRFDAETGMFYYRARYLHSNTGRFVSRDSLGLWTNMDNLGGGYVYISNNPVNWLDPLGLDKNDGWGDWHFDKGYFNESGQYCEDYIRFRPGPGGYSEADDVIYVSSESQKKTQCYSLGAESDVFWVVLALPDLRFPAPQAVDGDESGAQDDYAKCVSRALLDFKGCRLAIERTPSLAMEAVWGALEGDGLVAATAAGIPATEKFLKERFVKGGGRLGAVAARGAGGLAKVGKASGWLLVGAFAVGVGAGVTWRVLNQRKAAKRSAQQREHCVAIYLSDVRACGTGGRD